MHLCTLKIQKVKSAKMVDFLLLLFPELISGLPQWLSGRNLPASAGDMGSISELRQSPGKGNGSPLQFSCLENPLDKGAWQATVHRVVKELNMLRNLVTTSYSLLRLFLLYCQLNDPRVAVLKFFWRRKFHFSQLTVKLKTLNQYY